MDGYRRQAGASKTSLLTVNHTGYKSSKLGTLSSRGLSIHHILKRGGDMGCSHRLLSEYGFHRAYKQQLTTKNGAQELVRSILFDTHPIQITVW